MKRPPSFTLRELMILVAMACFATSAIMLGDWLASAFLVATLLIVAGFTIFAVVGTGKIQTFAVGCSVSAMVYVLALIFFTTVGGNLANSQIETGVIYPAYEWVVSREYLDSSTGQPLADNDPNREQRLPAGGYGSISGGPNVFVTESPNRKSFAMSAHVLILFVFAYTGGKFATWVASPYHESKQ